MNSLTLLITLVLAGYTLISQSPIKAGGCDNNSNKNQRIYCPKDDTNCKQNKNKTNNKGQHIES